MLLKIALGLLAVVVVLLGLIAARPAEFRVARSRTLAAPPAVVYGYVDDFTSWHAWSPWEKVDPTMKRELSGPATGPGAAYAWWGNSNIGEGRMTITEARQNQRITIRLEFLKPFAATNTAQFDFVPSGQGTNVTWAMSGQNGFMAKAIGLVMDMDEMIGTEFEKGLATLDEVSAAEAAKATAAQG